MSKRLVIVHVRGGVSQTEVACSRKRASMLSRARDTKIDRDRDGDQNTQEQETGRQRGTGVHGILPKGLQGID